MVRAETLERFSQTFAVTGFSPKAFLPSYGLAESTLAVTFAPLDRGVEVDRIDQDHYTHTGNVEPVLRRARSEEHTSELQSLMRISYAVFCLKKKKNSI